MRLLLLSAGVLSILAFFTPSGQDQPPRCEVACALNTDPNPAPLAAVMRAKMPNGLNYSLPSESNTSAASSIIAKGLPIQELWHRALEPVSDPPTCTPAANDQHLFVVTSGVEAYSADGGQLLWQSPLGRYIPRTLVTAHDRVFVAELTMSALDGVTGRRLWEFTPDANASMGRAATDGHTVYFGTASHRIYALRAADGKQLWAIDIGPKWKYPAVVRGVTLWRDKLYATIEQWRDAKGRSSTGWLIALKAKSGKVLWRYGTGEGNQRRGLSSSPLVTSRLVVAADFLSNAIVAIDRKSGREIWKFHGEPGFAGFPEVPAVIGNVLYIGSGDTYVYALGLATGRLLWRTKLSSSVQSYAACGQTLLVNDRALAVLDPATGRVLEKILDGEQDFPTSGPVVAGEKAFLVGPKAIHAFRCAIDSL